jgi:hypothetical protein
MSFTPAFAPDARSQWGALDFEFQEIVLDELDRLALDPPEHGEHIIDVVVEAGGFRHYLFLRVSVDHPQAMVTVIGVGYFARPTIP